MKMLHIVFYSLSVYVALVLLAEALIWRIQPSMDGGVTIIVRPDGADAIERTLYGFERDGQLFVSSNHWFRSWYHAALRYPDVDVTRDGETGPYSAVGVRGEEHERLSKNYKMGFVLRLICGFAPSRFLRLDPR